jgi:hypothetical protein
LHDVQLYSVPPSHDDKHSLWQLHSPVESIAEQLNNFWQDPAFQQALLQLLGHSIVSSELLMKEAGRPVLEILFHFTVRMY